MRPARVALALLAVLLLATARDGARGSPRDAGAPDAAADPIAWQLTGEPSTTLSMAQRHAFRLWLVARNTGAQTADTRRDELEMLVNGRASMSLAMGFGNGARVAAWGALPPGQSLREARDMGESLFPAPGAYEIALRRHGVVVAQLAVRVTP